MRLRKEMVEHIANTLVNSLVTDGYIIAEKPDALERCIHNAIIEDLMVEDKLNIEVKELMQEYLDKLKMGDNVDYGKVFQMIKQKLIKERGLII